MNELGNKYFGLRKRCTSDFCLPIKSKKVLFQVKKWGSSNAPDDVVVVVSAAEVVVVVSAAVVVVVVSAAVVVVVVVTVQVS